MVRKCLCALLVLSAAGGAFASPIQLDLSAGFNVDAWCGPAELQAVYEYATANDPDMDLGELQGVLTDGIGYSILDAQRLFVGASTEPYSTSAQWFHPSIISDAQGTPADGVLTGGDGRQYHIASYGGNATLAGDWLEVADVASTWASKDNAVLVGTAHRIETWQIASQTIELPAAQKGKYADINFVLSAMDAADRARNMQIVALYGAAGAEEQIVYSFSIADGGSGPMIDENNGGADFSIVHSVTKSYASASGMTGAIGNFNGSIYEFTNPLVLDDAKDLWGFRIQDSDPTMQNNARGLAIFGATATAVPEPATMSLLVLGGLALAARRRK